MGRLAPSLQRFLELPPAERRLGPFALVKQLGRGGFAPVWLVREVYGDTELRAAAVKLFSIEGSPTARERVIAEARALCRVEHPNVVRFYALSIDEERGIMGLAMEHVAGAPLHERLAARGRLGVADALAVGAAIASALAAVHRAGLVHRDVKPANIVETAGGPKLIDFGIAAADELGAGPRSPRLGAPRRLGDLPADAAGTRLTDLDSTAPLAMGDATLAFGMGTGTMGYIDPAILADGEPAMAASDLYALGATLFECLAGRLPAASAESGRLLGEVLDGRAPAPPLRDVAPGVPEPLAHLVDALLAPARRDRPASADEVAAALDRLRAELASPPEEPDPFRGLGCFHERDRRVFSGRSDEIAAALDRLRGCGLVTLVGPAGGGKSSLARAGVLPRVAEGALGGPAAWDVVIAEPGADLRAALAPFVDAVNERAPDEIARALTERAAGGRGLVLLLDPLADRATLAAGPAALLEALAARPLPGVRVLATLRFDRIDPLLSMRGLGEPLRRGAVRVEPMTEGEWTAALDQALARRGYAIEDDALRAEIAAQIAPMSGAMPLVAFALTELWEQRDRASKKLTRRALAAMGGLSGALERHAEATLAELGEERPGAEEAARAVLLALTTTRGALPARSAEQLTRAAGPQARAAIEALERARLVVVGEDGVTLAHDVLPASWPRREPEVEVAPAPKKPPERRASAAITVAAVLVAALGGAAYLRADRAPREHAVEPRATAEPMKPPVAHPPEPTNAPAARRIPPRLSTTRPVIAPPVSAPPVSAPPVSAPPVSAPPVSAPPVSAPPISPLPISPPPIAVPVGRAPAGPWLPAFTVHRQPGGEGLRWLVAAERCRDRGLALCTEVQWSRACDVEPSLAAAETWTITAEADRGFVVRGGASREVRRIAAGAETSPARAGVCCSRAVAIQSSGVDETRFAAMSRRLLAFEAAPRQGGAAVGVLLADSLRFFNNPAMPRRQVVSTFDSLLARSPDLWVVLDACDVTADAAARTWTADCHKEARQNGKIASVTTRLVWNEGETLVAIHDLEVMRTFSEP